ncbi:aminoglycoside phosphotransferase-related-related [Anaeramoeba ignava]|uniref:Aminoglycoside phosphotransferase-related-related n=1 Tax=Anaeramoeba ignava TaxID=1746090 RepID=A0A9Q0RF95_ANAIG|nr:aminoglycoside phosphotransferase-related-related [Anaeramoeba ignava]
MIQNDKFLLPKIENWEKWGTLFTNKDIWKDIIISICEKHGIKFKEMEAGFPGTNAVFVLDKKYVIKIFAPECSEDFRKEMNCLNLFSSCENMKFYQPKILFYGNYQDRREWIYLIISFIEGEAIRDERDKIKKENMVEIVEHLAALVKEMHQMDYCQNEYWEKLKGKLNWQNYFEKKKKETLESLREAKLVNDKAISEMEEKFKKIFDLDQEVDFVLVNGDLTEDHLLIKKSVQEPTSYRVSGLIDYGDAMIAPCEYEFVALWGSLLDFDPFLFHKFIIKYNKEINFDTSFRDKMMCFTLIHEFSFLIIKDFLTKKRIEKISSWDQIRDIFWKKELEEFNLK